MIMKTMYQIEVEVKVTEGLAAKESYEYKTMTGCPTRLLRNAKFDLAMIKTDKIAEGYAVELTNKKLYCYKSERTKQGDRTIHELRYNIIKL